MDRYENSFAYRTGKWHVRSADMQITLLKEMSIYWLRHKLSKGIVWLLFTRNIIWFQMLMA